MKKFFMFLLAGVLCAGFAACSDDDDEDEGGSSASGSSYSSSAIVGSWKMVNTWLGDYNDPDFKETWDWEEEGYHFYLYFYSDGTFKWVEGSTNSDWEDENHDDTATGTWSISGSYLSIHFESTYCPEGYADDEYTDEDDFDAYIAECTSDKLILHMLWYGDEFYDYNEFVRL